MHHTLIFNTFIFMTVFNEINSRVVGVRDFNVFFNFFSNWLYLGVIFGTIVLQLSMMEYLGRFMGAAKLTPQQNASCIVLGFSVLLVSLVLKATPPHWVQKIPITVDENRKIDEDDPIMKGYRNSMKAKVTIPPLKKAEDNTGIQNE